MVCLSHCNYFDADDRDWLFACGLMSVHSASQDMHSQTRMLAWKELNGSPLNAINPLDSFNKGLKIMFYVQRKKKSTVHMQLLRNP